MPHRATHIHTFPRWTKAFAGIKGNWYEIFGVVRESPTDWFFQSEWVVWVRGTGDVGFTSISLLTLLDQQSVARAEEVCWEVLKFFGNRTILGIPELLYPGSVLQVGLSGKEVNLHLLERRLGVPVMIPLDEIRQIMMLMGYISSLLPTEEK